MVARNFSLQESPYSKLLHVPDDSRGGDYITLEELKPVNVQLSPQTHHHYQTTYYTEDPCSSSVSYQSNSNSRINSTTMEIPQVDSTLNPTRRKRKASFQENSDAKEDTGDDNRSVKTTDENKKQNHSEIEKRRRDKMNTYITELSAMVPMCHAMSRKLDKLTVLRMAVQHLKTIRGAVHSYTEGHYKPSFLSDQELKHLILQAADGFLFVVGCDRGKILYVSESVTKVLSFSQADLLGQSLFDILHPKDVAKVKEQLSSSDLNPRERLIDAKTMLPVKTEVPHGVTRLCPGARRSFFCRMKCKPPTHVKEEADTTTGCHRKKKQQISDKKYSVIQCTGYLKSWEPAKIGLEETENETDGDTCNLSCLVAIGRILPHISAITAIGHSTNNVKPIQFISRHTLDGKFLFVDQRATLILGFLPQELLGSSMYEYYHHEDIHIIAECHKCALQNSDKVNSKPYGFRTKDGSFVQLQSELKAFRNPWTKEIEYIIFKNNLVLSECRVLESSTSQSKRLQEGFDIFSQSNGKDIQKMINTHVEASKIGRQIAEQVMDSQRRGELSSESSPDPGTESSIQMSSGESPMSSIQSDRPPCQSVIQELSQTADVKTNIPLTMPPNDPVLGGNADEGMIDIIENAVTDSTSNVPNSEGNDEAAMAVIMSLLEADAGLGGPVDFSGLPWPLP